MRMPRSPGDAREAAVGGAERPQSTAASSADTALLVPSTVSPPMTTSTLEMRTQVQWAARAAAINGGLQRGHGVVGSQHGRAPL